MIKSFRANGIDYDRDRRVTYNNVPGWEWTAWRTGTGGRVHAGHRFIASRQVCETMRGRWTAPTTRADVIEWFDLYVIESREGLAMPMLTVWVEL